MSAHYPTKSTMDAGRRAGRGLSPLAPLAGNGRVTRPTNLGSLPEPWLGGSGCLVPKVESSIAPRNQAKR